VDHDALQQVADLVSRGRTAAYVQRVQLSGRCHALGFVQPGTSPANPNEENEPQPTERQIVVLTNEQQQLAQDLEMPLDSIRLLHVNSSSHAAADVAVQLQLHITARRDAPFFSSLTLAFAARGCSSSSGSSSSSSSNAVQPEVSIEPIGRSTGSAASQTTYKRQLEDQAQLLEVQKLFNLMLQAAQLCMYTSVPGYARPSFTGRVLLAALPVYGNILQQGIFNRQVATCNGIRTLASCLSIQDATSNCTCCCDHRWLAGYPHNCCCCSFYGCLAGHRNNCHLSSSSRRQLHSNN
jgi:hypothetical protein